MISFTDVSEEGWDCAGKAHPGAALQFKHWYFISLSSKADNPPPFPFSLFNLKKKKKGKDIQSVFFFLGCRVNPHFGNKGNERVLLLVN